MDKEYPKIGAIVKDRVNEQTYIVLEYRTSVHKLEYATIYCIEENVKRTIFKYILSRCELNE